MNVDAKFDAVVRATISNLSGFFARWSEVEHAPRWTCTECQFEQNQHHASHAPGCSQRAGAA